MNRLLYRLLSSGLGARMELKILMGQTAKAFGVDAPKAAGRSAQALLRTYAQFTADASMRAAQSGQDTELLHQELHRIAESLGSSLRRWLRPQDAQDCLAIIKVLYRNIGIQIDEETPGTFCVSECYFSAFYTPDICNTISAIDQGIFAGIYQDGTLTFSERITEGQGACRADLRQDSAQTRKDGLLE